MTPRPTPPTFAAPRTPAPYEPPRLVRVALGITREHMHHQYAGDINCTRHSHSDPGAGANGCTFPQ